MVEMPGVKPGSKTFLAFQLFTRLVSSMALMTGADQISSRMIYVSLGLIGANQTD